MEFLREKDGKFLMLMTEDELQYFAELLLKDENENPDRQDPMLDSIANAYAQVSNYMLKKILEKVERMLGKDD